MSYTWFCTEGVDRRPLRYMLCLALMRSGGALSVPDLIAIISQSGIPIARRPSKTVSDALRTEIRRGRVVRVGRSLYRTGRVPESTGRWMQQWLATHPIVIVAKTLREDGTFEVEERAPVIVPAALRATMGR